MQNKIAYINFSAYPARNIEKKISAMAMGAHEAGISNFDFLYIHGKKNDLSGLVKYVKYPDLTLGIPAGTQPAFISFQNIVL